MTQTVELQEDERRLAVFSSALPPAWDKLVWAACC
jgi:hypothetical protein